MKEHKKKKHVVLGLNGWPERGHDASACLVIDGKIVAFVEEERFTRKRYSYDTLPIKAVAYCLKKGKVSVDEIDHVVYGWDKQHTYHLRQKQLPFTHKDLLLQLFPPNAFPSHTLPALEFINHHLAHAASTYRVSGFKNASILIVDGQGEDASCTLAHGKDGKISILSTIPISYSLGYMMEAACKHIGLRTSDAGKLMGLAGHGKKAKMFNNVVLTKDGYVIKDFNSDEVLFEKSAKKGNLDEQAEVIAQWDKYFALHYPLEVVEKKKFDTLRGDFETEIVFNQKHKDFALSVQKTLEETVIHLAKILTQKTGCKNLVMAGGVALNCSTNGRLLAEDIVDKLFIQPAANDAGVSIGAALEVAHKEKDTQTPAMKHIYYGPEYNDTEIKKVLDTLKVSYKKEKNIERVAAKALANGSVVAWFQGRMEGGPRALGNRSILADPRKKHMHSHVNMIKSRENWRPLAPSILEEDVKEYFGHSIDSPFMLQRHWVKKEKAKKVPAIVHNDLSARYQSVSKKTNPKYHALISAFKKLTDIPLVMNTSFNTAGEPLVCTPEQAIKTFYGSPIDALAIGSYWITKNEKK